MGNLAKFSAASKSCISMRKFSSRKLKIRQGPRTITFRHGVCANKRVFAVHSQFLSILNRIKSLRIQGAEAVSREAVMALKIAAHSSKAKGASSFIEEMKSAADELAKARPTEPYLRNALDSAFFGVGGRTAAETRESFLSRIQKTLFSMEQARKQVVETGAKRIKSGMVVFTHCHSSTVTAILIEAKRQGRKFTVHNTETRPLFQGRKTAKELSDAGIKVRYFVDSAARLALKKADIMLIGADAITSEGKVINKIGSELFAEAAHRRDIPVYACTNSWKFDPETVFGFEEEIEERDAREVWPNHPKNVEIDNHAFEIINPELVDGVITELGIYEPMVLIEEIRRAYPWMIKKKKLFF